MRKFLLLCAAFGALIALNGCKDKGEQPPVLGKPVVDENETDVPIAEPEGNLTLDIENPPEP